MALFKGTGTGGRTLFITNNGDKKLMKQLEKLGPRVAKRVLRRAASLSVNPSLKQARKDAPKDEGILRKNVIKKVKTFRSGVIAFVGVRYGVENPDRPDTLGPHAYGWVQERNEPFMEPALEQNQARILSTFRSELVSGMVREANKLRGR